MTPQRLSGKGDVSIAPRFALSRFPLSMPSLKRISGRDNAEFKRFLAARSRRSAGLILVEGPKLLEEAIRSRLVVRMVAVDENRAATNPFPDLPRVQFASALMRSLADVETHQGMLALVERPAEDRAWLGVNDAFILILDGLQDPGNVGTLFRSAEAAGVTGLLLTRGCADPLSPKALRASAGSAFRLPHVSDLGAEEALSLLAAPARLMAATVGPGAASIFEAPVDLPLALALGSEGSGLSEKIESAATLRIHIPVARKVESLNVAAAGAIVMFEIARRAGKLR